MTVLYNQLPIFASSSVAWTANYSGLFTVVGPIPLTLSFTLSLTTGSSNVDVTLYTSYAFTSYSS